MNSMYVLSILIFACLRTVSAAPEDEFAGWFSNININSNSNTDGSSSPPPPPKGGGGSSQQQQLPSVPCSNVGDLLGDKNGIDDVNVLKRTLVVDNCLLDCGNQILYSTVWEGSVVTVRNGGHVKNCPIVLVEEPSDDNDNDSDNDNNEDNDNDNDNEIISPGTDAPTVWGTYITTGDTTNDPTEWGTYYAIMSSYLPNPVAGFLCDEGDCFLENVSCSVVHEDDMDIDGNSKNKNALPASYRPSPGSLLVMRECVLVKSGAADVTVKGGLVTEDDRIVTMYGIVVDAAKSNEEEEDEDEAIQAPVEEEGEGEENQTTTTTTTRLFVDNVTIENQAFDGIKIIGGVETVRITDSTLSGNGNNGIDVDGGGDGLELFAVFGGSIENNGKSGIDVSQRRRRRRSKSIDKEEESLDTETEMVIADVSINNNQGNGILVVRVDKVAIDNTVLDGNRFNGIDVREANAISLQGVVSKNNVQNGLSVEAIGADVDIKNSIFLANGYDLDNNRSPHWKRAGVYMWLSKRVTITNSVSNNNSMDGFLIYDVPNLSMIDVDAMRNGDDGVQIRESSAAYGYDYTANSDYLVGAYYYPWHGKNFHNGGGYLRKDLIPPQVPTLGEYDDSDPEIINQHMAWFRKANIGLLVTSWWGPDRIEDTNTRKVLMEHDHIGNLKIALHYETTGRIKEDAGDDMSVPRSDIQYMCKHYFDHPNYYKIDGRPVVVMYLSRKLARLNTLEEALLTMRSEASKCGHNIYLIGDAVFAKAPDDDENPFISFVYFDAVTNYDVYGSSGAPDQTSPYAGPEAVDNYYAEQEKWRNLALKENCRYIPPVSPGYNDRGVRLEKNHLPLSRRLTESSYEGSLFMYQLKKALPLVDPAVDNLILVNSFNEWHEDTQIEPVWDETAGNIISTKPDELTGGLEYVGYGERYLDILRTATNRAADANNNNNNNNDGPDFVYESSNVDFTNVHSCKNGNDGMTFYITDNNIEFDNNDIAGDGGASELVFTPGPGVVSCKNTRFDYELHGGGDIDFVASSSALVGDKCSNGKGKFSCDALPIEDCKMSDCRHRDIVTSGGAILNDHKIE